MRLNVNAVSDLTHWFYITWPEQAELRIIFGQSKYRAIRLLASILSDQLMAFSLYSFQNLFQLCFSKPENQDLKTSNKVISFFLLPENWFHKHLKFILYYQNLMYTIKNLTIKCFWFNLSSYKEIFGSLGKRYNNITSYI